MPSSITDESLWDKAKEVAAKEGHGKDYAYITGIYKRMGGKFEKKDYEKTLGPVTMEIYEKAEHLDPSKKSKLQKEYRSGNYSVRELADKEGVSRHQVEGSVKGVSSPAKSKEGIAHHQSEHARWKGKTLPKHIVDANHEGRNKAIEKRPATSMEGPVSRALHKLGVSFKTQVDFNHFFNLDNVEAGIADFYIPSKRLFIQADGPRHSLDNVKARVGKQDSIIRSHGYKVLHITPKDMDSLTDILRRHVAQ